MLIKKILLILRTILFEKKIILLSSPLQFINYGEFIFINKDLKLIFNNTNIFSVYNSATSLAKAKSTLKLFNLSHVNIIDCSNKYEVKYFYFCLFVKKLFFKKFDLFILGNFNSYLGKKIMSLSKKKFILDDGTNIFDKKNLKNLKNLKMPIFSFFDSFYFNKIYYTENKFLFLKRKFNLNKQTSDEHFLLGSLGLQLNFYTIEQYKKFILNIVKRLKIKKIFYLPHPKEKIEHIKSLKFKFLKIIRTNDPAELFFLKKKKYPKYILSINSTAAIVLKKINKNINIFNYCFPKQLLIPRHYSILKYFNTIGVKNEKFMN